jgi:polar amino acid transport system substrate-binding protein
LFLLAGCAPEPLPQDATGVEPNPVEGAAPAGQDTDPSATGTLARVQRDGLVRVGIRFDFPPISYIDAAGEWVGFDVDLAQAMADALGVELEAVRVDETTRISFLQSGRIDLAIASMNHTQSREEAIDFSQSYFWGRQTFLVPAGSAQDLSDLFGQPVAMNKGSSAIDGWQAWAAANGGEAGPIVEFADKQEALAALRSGAVRGYGEDDLPLLGLAGNDPGLTLVDGGFNPVRYGMGVRENDSDWRDAVNLALQDVWASGDYAVIHAKWFGEGSDTPLPLPASDALEVWP